MIYKHNTMVKRHRTNNDLQNTTQWSKDTGQTMIYKTQHNGQKDKRQTMIYKTQYNGQKIQDKQ